MSKLDLTLIILMLGVTNSACQGKQPHDTASPQGTHDPIVAPSPPKPSDRSTKRIRIVEERHLVCMVNDQLMGVQQIPVQVGELTYFGCCPNCKERLENDPKARNAVDPVSGASVDKALAVIGAKPDGRILYFETEANLKAYGAL